MNRMLFAGCLLGFALFSCATKEANATSTTNYKDEARKLNEMLASAGVSPQQFEIPSGKPSEITGAKGIYIRIKPSDLETENGKPISGKITVALRELTEPSDFIFSDARTQASNHKQLLSSGTYFISMRSGENEVRIRPGHALAIDFRRFSTKRMELFTAAKDSIQNLDWVPSNARLKRIGIQDANVEDEEYYETIPVNRLGWISSAVFNRSRNGAAAFNIENSDGFSFGKAFLVVSENGTTASLESTLFFNGRDDLFFDGVPSKGQAIFACAALKKGKFFGFATRVDLENLEMPTIRLEQMQPSELYQRVQNLK